MRAVLIHDRQVVLGEVPEPVPAAGDVLVRVVCAGLNLADLHQVAGRYSAPPGWPAEIPGMELAGVVEAVGARVEAWRPGDRVMGLVGGGAQAEKAVVRDSALLRVPEAVPLRSAGGFPEAFTTAWDALVAQAGLRAGERVLVTGAAGGVGTAAVQLAALAGADVVGSVRSEEGRNRLAALVPAARVIPSGAEETAGPFDVILELVGGPDSMQRIRLLTTGGRIVVIGVGAGAKVPIPLGALMSVRGRVMASTLRARPESEKAETAERIRRLVVPSFGQGRLQVPIDSTFPLEAAVEAYARMAAPGKFGKVLLTVGE